MCIAVLVVALSGVAWAETKEIAGIVVDEAGNPVAGASFTVLGMKTGAAWDFGVLGETKTGLDGRFSLSLDAAVVKPRQTFLAARHPDYGLAWTMDFMLSAKGEDLSNVRLTLPKRGSVQGKVSDAAGRPVKGAVVTAWISPKDVNKRSYLPPCEALLSATTGADGTFTLDGLPQNTAVVLRVAHPEFVVELEGVPESPERGFIGTIDVGAKDITVKLEPGATVEGRVTWEGTGKAAAQAEVSAIPVQAGRDVLASLLGVVKAQTDENGSYVLKGLAPAPYSLRVSHPDGVAAPKRVELAAAAHLTGQDITLGKGVLVAGKFVKAGAGEPVSGAQLFIQRKDEGGSAYPVVVEVRPDGTFECRVAPGDITLSANVISGSLSQEQRTREMTLVAGQDKTDLIFEVEPPVMFKGKVIGPDGKAVAGAKVSTKWGGEQVPVETAQDGTFELPLPPWFRFDNYQVFFVEATHPDLTGYRGLLGKRLQSKEDATGEIRLTPVGVIRGRVVGVDGKPIPSAKVSTQVRSEQNGISDGHYECDAAGRYEVKDAVGGAEYAVLAQADKYGQCLSGQFTLDPGGTHEVEDLTLVVADKSVEGTVEDENGSPLANVQLQCYGQGTGNRNAQSDAKGHFRIENLVDESLQVWAWYNGPNGNLQGRAQPMAGDADVKIVMGQQAQPENPEERKARLLVDKEAPGLEVDAWVHGDAATLESLRGVPVVLAFWDSAHPSSPDMVALLNRLCEKHPNVPVIAVHSVAGQDPAAARAALKKLVKEQGVQFRVAMDKPGKGPGATCEKYKAKPPSVYLIDAEGKVRFQDLPLPAVEEVVQTLIGEK
jgi:protocatechuate 3,4-dioxygenase beta subunit